MSNGGHAGGYSGSAASSRLNVAGEVARKRRYRVNDDRPNESTANVGTNTGSVSVKESTDRICGPQCGRFSAVVGPGYPAIPRKSAGVPT